MAFDTKGLDSYVDVASRIAEFRNAYNTGCLRPADLTKPYDLVTIDGKMFVVYVAAAYRSPDDTLPGIGMAWEPFPGKTPYTKDSELQNAETAAWGRAIIAVLAADSRRGVATSEDVRNRQADRVAEPDPVDSQVLVDGYLAEIERTTVEELTALGTNIRAKLRNREITQAQYDRLVSAGGARRAELEAS